MADALRAYEVKYHMQQNLMNMVSHLSELLHSAQTRIIITCSSMRPLIILRGSAQLTLNHSVACLCGIRPIAWRVSLRR